MSTQPAVKPDTQPLRVNGRDPDGFVEGSEEQRQFRRMCRKYSHEDNAVRRRYYRNTRTRQREAALMCPEVITGEAQKRARRAARALGVEVPDWASGWSDYR